MNLKSVKNHKNKRLGRGISAGGGKTAGRGTKGQKSRSGFNLPTRFEGGQTALSMRLPKLTGFKSHKAKATVISLDQISNFFKDGESVSKEALVEKGLLAQNGKAKILNNGKLTVKVSIAPEIAASESVKSLFEKTEITKEEVKKPTKQTASTKTPKKTESKPKVAKKK